MTLEDFMKAIQYRITGGDPYCWDSFGTKARWLNCDDIETYSASVVYDSENQTIYSAEAHDYKLERAYRWINPEYLTVYREESQRRNVDIKKAWDAVNFTDLETEEDFLTKCSAIVKGESYDNRVTVPIDLDDDEIFELMKMAHKKDITLNQLVESILTEMIQKHSVAV